MEKTAIIFVHGIVGRPEQFRDFLPLVPKDWTIRNVTIEGHCKTPMDFAKSSMKNWKSQIHGIVQEVAASHDKVYFVGHSMGTLFAIQESIQVPLDGLFLMNVPLHFCITGRILKLCWQVARNKIDMDDKWMKAGYEAYGMSPDPNLIHYLLWVPRLLELTVEIRRTRKMIDKIETKTWAYICKQDEIASPKSADIFRKKSNVVVKELCNSGHFYYDAEDKKVLLNDFVKFIEENG